MKEIAKYIDVSENTVNCWYYCNTQGLKEKVQMWRIDKMLIDAEKVSSEILGYCPLKSDGTVDASILAVQQRESAFLREKLVIARDTYNTKSVNIVNVIPPVPILGNIFREA